ncbi:hypothetical protein [Microcoleus sp. CAWBG58]|uniref:hypothetical protein n=1 Tax=Microcoleus sp. CAWBG58 TaxID=2841651 RepID=UPI0025F0D4A0|nr:hypothetical protein [Microcoleus sp. CAWBG58]
MSSSIIPYQGGSGETDGGGIAPHVISHGYEDVSGLMSKYYGFDLSAIPNMSIDELGAMKDASVKSKWLADNLHLIEELVTDWIDGQVAWSTMQAALVKKGAKGAEKIDKATADMVLAQYRYERGVEKQGERVRAGQELADNKLANFFTKSAHQLSVNLQIEADKLATEMAAISEAPDKAFAMAQFNQQRKTALQAATNYLKFGSAAAVLPSATGQVFESQNRIGYQGQAALPSASRPIAFGGIRGAATKVKNAAGAVKGFGQNVARGLGKIGKFLRG